VLTIGGATARLNLRYGNWQAVVDHPIELGMDAAAAGLSAVAYCEGIATYAKGMLAVSRKDLDGAARQSDAMDAIAWRLHADVEHDK